MTDIREERSPEALLYRVVEILMAAQMVASEALGESHGPESIEWEGIYYSLEGSIGSLHMNLQRPELKDLINRCVDFSRRMEEESDETAKEQS